MLFTKGSTALFVLASSVVAGAATPAEAGDSNGDFQIRAGVSGVVFDTDVKSVRTSTGVDLRAAANADANVEDIVVPTLTLTYFFTKNFAAELNCCTGRINLEGTKGFAALNTLADAWVLPPVVTLQYRFDRFAGFQPYVGAGVEWIHYWSGDGDNAVGATKVKIDDSFGFALQAGLDYDLGGGWSLDVDVKKAWLGTTVTWERTDLPGNPSVVSKADVDPLWITGSVGYRFNIEDLFKSRSAPASLK